MRVAGCGFVGKSLEKVKELSRKVTEVTHNHQEGIKGAEATVVAVYLAKSGTKIPEIRAYIEENYYDAERMNFCLNNIRESYKFNEICQDTVPEALMAFFESTSYEDAIRNAISIGGDSDTIAAITGGIAEAYYGVPSELRQQALPYLDDRLTEILNEFESVFLAK